MKRSLYEKETYLSLHPVIFLYGWNPDFSCLNLWSFKEFWADRWFCETTAQDKADYVTYYEKSAQLNQSPLTFLFVSLILIALLATFYFLFMKQDLLTAHYTYMGQILLSQAFSCYNYFAGRPLLASFSTPSLRQRYLASSSIALLLLTALSLLFLGIVLYKTLRLRKAQATA